MTILDRKKLTKALSLLAIDHTANTLSNFETEVSKFLEVMECFQMTGAFDFILRIATCDMEAYHQFTGIN